MSEAGSQPPTTHLEEHGILTSLTASRALSTGAIAFIYMALASFLGIGGLLIYSALREERIAIWQQFVPEMILACTGVFSALIGVNLLGSLGAATSSAPPAPVINPNEWKSLESKIQDGDDDAVTQYIRLRSLGGVAGYF